MKKLPAAFYRSASGREPVREWVKDLSRGDRRLLPRCWQRGIWLAGWDAALPAAWQWSLEIRSDLSGGRIARVIFCVHAGNMVLLHGFEKKSQKTPKPDLETARKRQKEIGQ